MPLRPAALLLLLAAPAAMLAGCADEAEPAEAAAGDVAVENLRLVQEEDGSRAVRGVVVNEGRQERSVQVVIALYDGMNQPIGEVQVPVANVEPGGQQGFSRALDQEAAGASVHRILLF